MDDRDPADFDDNDDDLIYLVDEEGNEYGFELLHILELDGRSYAVLMPEDDDEEGDEDSSALVIMRLEKDEEGEDVLVDLDNDDELKRAATAWEAYLDSEDSHDHDDEEGDDEDGKLSN